MLNIYGLPGLSLSGQLDNVVIEAMTDVTFAISYKEEFIFSSRYVPDAQHRVVIPDIVSILEPYLLREPLCDFTYALVNLDGDSIVSDFSVLYCRYKVTCDALKFVDHYFLSPMANRDKLTFVGRKEMLYVTRGFTPKEDTPPLEPYAECFYADGQNKVVTHRVPLGSFPCPVIDGFDASPSLMERPGLRLLRYVVYCGNRQTTYRVGFGNSDSLCVRFTSSFGQPEYFYFNGIVEQEQQIERSSAYFTGIRKNYALSEGVQFKANSGYLPDSMKELADDLARSTDAVLVCDDGTEIPIVITESSTLRSNSVTELFSLELTFSLADRHSLPLPLLPNIFDDTFDDTFN